jgi:hypothetical protein
MKLGFLTLMICLVSAPLRAELRLTSVITDHAVLQRDTANPSPPQQMIWASGRHGLNRRRPAGPSPSPSTETLS